MANLEVWQLITDALLVLSLFYLCARSAKVSPLIQSSTLENNLRRMVQEADLVTRALQEKLVQRQTRLEELLMDLETAENRLNRGKQDIEETRADLESRFIKAQRALQALQIQIETVSNDKAKSLVADNKENELSLSDKNNERNLSENVTSGLRSKIEKSSYVTESQDNVDSEVTFETASLEPATYGRKRMLNKAYGNVATASTKTNAKTNIYGDAIAEDDLAELDASPVQKRNVKTNIYGEVLADEDTYSGAGKENVAKKGLASKVEKEVVSQAKQATAVTAKSAGYSQEEDIQSVYDKAEALINAGKSLESVARLTALPLDEVRMLSQMLDRVPLVSNKNANKAEDLEFTDLSEKSVVRDQRLGALDPVRRSIQTI